MTSYFSAITFINIFSLLLLFILIESNTVISRHQKNQFSISCFIILIICIMEVLTIIFDGSPLRFKFFHIASNFFGFSLTPLLFLTLGNALLPNPQKQKSINPFIFVWIAYILWFLISLFTGNGYSVFFVDEMNNYSRAKGFIVYMISYALGLVYFLVQNINLSTRYLQTSNTILFLNFIFILAGTTIQILLPEIQITWTTVIISMFVYFIYLDTLYQQLDSQTYLKNQNSFYKSLNNLKNDSVLIVVEIDHFSKLKMNYNREKIDNIILEISNVFRKFYRKYGQCYRIGSEEFYVVVKDTSLDFDNLNKEFFKEFVKETFEMEDMTLISAGWGKLSEKASKDESELNKTFSEADLKKHEFIKERVNYLS